jgi:hypothetical protein
MLNKKALAGSVSAAPAVYVEDVFSIYLYTGTGATQTITNGIDLSGKGGLTWIKGRSGATGHRLTDTTRGATKSLELNSTAAEATESTGLTAFGSTGFTIGADADYNTNAATYASWTLQKQAKFFDVVTYTGNGANRTIAHNLGSVPGSIWIKRTDTTGDWQCYHRSLANTEYLVLNDTAAKATGADRWNSTTPTSSVFSLGTNANVNASGGTYIAYIFAHDASGFGTAGTDNVISCGSFTGNGSVTGPVITLGYEPQFILTKNTTTGSSNWVMYDSMRGFSMTSGEYLLPQSSGAGGEQLNYIPLATGFQVVTDNTLNTNGDIYIYMAIRRGLMKTPTSGTSVFSPNAYAGAGAGTTYTTNFPVDLTLVKNRGTTSDTEVWDRLRSNYAYLFSSSTNSEGTAFGTTNQWLVDRNNGVKWNADDSFACSSGNNYASWNFRRAPGFFDEVCYTGTGSNRTITHNLGVVPELMIVKRRSATNAWAVYANNDNTDYLVLNTTAATADDSTYWNDTSPTSSVFSVGTNNAVNASASTYVAYLFATVTGVSKVGSYTGNGSNQTINCGFTSGARFVLIKRTDSTGDWCIFDTARGIVSGNDSFLQLNSTAAEVTNEDAVDTDNSGFIVNETTEALNTNAANYIFLAIA